MTAGSLPLRRAPWTALAAGAIALGMDVLYVVILRSEGEGDLHSARTQLIVASLAASAAVALGGWFVRKPRLRLGLLTAASFTLLGWGFLAMFSIGLPILVAGALLLVSASHTGDGLSTTERSAMTTGPHLGARSRRRDHRDNELTTCPRRSAASDALLRRPSARRPAEPRGARRHRLSALRRVPVGPVGEALLGTLDGGQLLPQIVRQTLVELVLVEIGAEIRGVGVVRDLAVVLRASSARALARSGHARPRAAPGHDPHPFRHGNAPTRRLHSPAQQAGDPSTGWSLSRTTAQAVSLSRVGRAGLEPATLGLKVLQM